jgi:hypothetical protein
MGPENEGFGYFGAASHLFIFRWSYFPFICILIAGLRLWLNQPALSPSGNKGALFQISPTWQLFGCFFSRVY